MQEKKILSHFSTCYLCCVQHTAEVNPDIVSKGGKDRTGGPQSWPGPIPPDWAICQLHACDLHCPPWWQASSPLKSTFLSKGTEWPCWRSLESDELEPESQPSSLTSSVTSCSPFSYHDKTGIKSLWSKVLVKSSKYNAPKTPGPIVIWSSSSPLPLPSIHSKH